MIERAPRACPVCRGADLELVFRWDDPPEGETRFSLREGERYAREFRACRRCGHFVGSSAVDPLKLYEREYVDATYGEGDLGASFERIMALPPQASDNAQRVRRVVSFMGRENGGSGRLLDVGSGLCVFAARMQDEGWSCTALDPDPRAVAHARDRVGVEATQGDFMTAEDLGTFDLVTFNKVLEHVDDPAALLERGRQHLREGGAVYLEVPDGEMAARAGPGREEFFIEHLHAFSMVSLCLTARAAGLVVEEARRLREPSGKYTLFAFARSGPAVSASPEPPT